MPKPANDKRPLITAALVTSGTVLAASGLAMLSWPAAPLVAKGWNLIGITSKGVGTVHQIAAVSFLGSAGIHVFDRRRAVARHLKATARGLLPAKVAEEGSSAKQV
jgi:cytochrome b subunit of formate dehydrogenase